MIFIIFEFKRNLIRVTKFLYRNFDPTWRLIAIKIPSLIREKNALVLLFLPITNPSNLETIFLLPRHNSIQSGIKSQTNNALIILPNGLERYIYIYNSKVEDRKREQRVPYPLSSSGTSSTTVRNTDAHACTRTRTLVRRLQKDRVVCTRLYTRRKSSLGCIHACMHARIYCSSDRGGTRMTSDRL